MKKSLFFIPAALLAFASCSNEDFDGNTNNGYQGETEPRYLSVNIVDNNGGGTRAENTTGYENGTKEENEVSFVRFYLFGDPNSTAEEKFNNTYIDCTAEEITNTGAPNVEKMLHSVIVFEAPKGTDAPIQIVAVVNPPEGTIGLAESYESPEKLQEVINNYNITTEGKFILTNAVYLDTENGNEEHVGYTVPKSYTSREEALINPVDIYVERVVAKARVEVDMDKNENGYYDILTKNDGDVLSIEVFNPETEQLDETEVYLNLLGWNVTGTAKETRLVKKVEEDWALNTTLNSWNWNHSAYYRSYWAENTADVGTKENLAFGSFNGTDERAAYAVKGFDSKSNNFTYLLENAAKDATGVSADYATKLIVAAQLVDAEGKGINLAWWKGTYYYMNDLLTVLAKESRIYTFDETTSTYVALDPQNLTYNTYTEVNNVTGVDLPNNNDRRYYSYVQYNGTPTGNNWYRKNGKGEYKWIDANEVNTILKNLDIVKVWNGGHTYYWTDITHLGKKPEGDAKNYGYTGIVRNHIYDYELTGFIGLGVPVLRDSETIYPEEPKDPEYAFIAARINILAWRFVGHTSTQLGWE